MTEFLTNDIIDLCRQAAVIAYQYYDNPPQELKSDRSVVTAADKAIEHLLARSFDRPEEKSYLIGEETVETHGEEYLTEALSSNCCWVVDPIDGTAPYVTHFPAWGISIGLMRNGIFTDGAIFLPELDRLLITEGNKVYEYRKIMTDTPVRAEFSFRFPPLSSGAPIAIPQRYAKRGQITFDNPVFTWCACVASFYYLFSGKLQGYLVSAKLWDVAAAFAMLKRSDWHIFDVENQVFFSGDAADGCFLLAADSPVRWMLKGPLVIGATSEITAFIAAHVSIAKTTQQQQECHG